jgi:hypothetical protein
MVFENVRVEVRSGRVFMTVMRDGDRVGARDQGKTDLLRQAVSSVLGRDIAGRNMEHKAMLQKPHRGRCRHCRLPQ